MKEHNNMCSERKAQTHICIHIYMKIHAYSQLGKTSKCAAPFTVKNKYTHTYTHIHTYIHRQTNVNANEHTQTDIHNLQHRFEINGGISTYRHHSQNRTDS